MTMIVGCGGHLGTPPTGRYSVRLVNPNGSSEETIKEIIAAVDQLHTYSSHIFSTIKKRVDEQRAQLQGLDARLNIASDKVEKVKSIQKAIKIISPAKYPLDLDALGDNQVGSRYLNLPLKPLVVQQVIDKSKETELGVELIEKRKTRPYRFDPPIKHPDDLLACYHVREPHITPLQLSLQQQGLGSPPENLELMDSFLLFNCAENPYHNYRIPKQTPLGYSPEPRFTRKNVTLDSSKYLLPQSVTSPEEEEERDVMDDFYYSPSTMQIPEFDVPEFLPNLPGIVDDLGFSPVSDAPTKPFFTFGNQAQRPSTLDTAAPVPRAEPIFISTPVIQTPIKSQTDSGSKDIPKITAKPPEEMSTSILPPPPTKQNQAIPPPPPPPPAPAVEKSSDGTATTKIKTAPRATSGGDDTRSNLMEAIRAAGGAGKATLRSAQERKYEAKKKKQEEKEKSDTGGATEDGDLMADLKKTLVMRRKGISGIRDPKQVGGVGDIMQRLVDAIPAMERSTESASVGENDSDDDNKDDWD